MSINSAKENRKEGQISTREGDVDMEDLEEDEGKPVSCYDEKGEDI